MTGTLRADFRTVDVGDDVLTAISNADGKAWICDSHGTMTAATLVHDGQICVLRCEERLWRHVRREVEVRPRGARR